MMYQATFPCVPLDVADAEQVAALHGPREPGPAFSRPTPEERQGAREHLELMRSQGAEQKSFRFMRQDVLSGKWVMFNIGGEAKAVKPRQITADSAAPAPPVGSLPAVNDTCPFCLGAEPGIQSGDVLRFGSDAELIQDLASRPS